MAHPIGKNPLMVIRSNRLKVEIAAPGSIYNRTRFDWTGFITQVTLDDRHTFCVPEDYDPAAGTGGIGLCNEFGIEKSIGFDEALPGQAFPKLGIGLITRPDHEPYNFFRPYEIAQPFPIQIESESSQVRFTVEPLECRGYAVRQTKTVQVDENCLHIHYQLENVGSRPIVTHEYCHNFVGIDRQPTGPGYRLQFPYPLSFEKLPENHHHSLDVLQVQGPQIRWKSTPETPFYCRPLGYSKTSQPQWELIHEPGGVGMREYDDFPPVRVALWGAAHVISAEIFNDINIQPGQSQSWTRRYEFFA